MSTVSPLSPVSTVSLWPLSPLCPLCPFSPKSTVPGRVPGTVCPVYPVSTVSLSASSRVSRLFFSSSCKQQIRLIAIKIKGSVYETNMKHCIVLFMPSLIREAYDTTTNSDEFFDLASRVGVCHFRSKKLSDRSCCQKLKADGMWKDFKFSWPSPPGIESMDFP